MPDDHDAEICDQCLALRPIGALQPVPRHEMAGRSTRGDDDALLACVDRDACERRQRE